MSSVCAPYVCMIGVCGGLMLSVCSLWSMRSCRSVSFGLHYVALMTCWQLITDTHAHTEMYSTAASSYTWQQYSQLNKGDGEKEYLCLWVMGIHSTSTFTKSLLCSEVLSL